MLNKIDFFLNFYNKNFTGTFKYLFSGVHDVYFKGNDDITIKNNIYFCVHVNDTKITIYGRGSKILRFQ